MSLSQKIKTTKFQKSVAGYSQKDVDSFIETTAVSVCELEQQLSALRAKLDAYESRTDEIKKLENEAQRLLEAAKNEAKEIVAKAKVEADNVNSDAEAKAKAILSLASEKGKAIVEKAKGEADEISKKAAATVKECDAFEAQFRLAVADTVKKLSAIRSGAPKVCVKEETPEVQKVKKSEPPKPREKTQRKPYDTVTVTYDSEDDYADVKKLKEESKNKLKDTPKF